MITVIRGVKTSKLLYRSHHMSIRKPHTRQTDFKCTKMLCFQYIWKYSRRRRIFTTTLFLLYISQNIGDEVFWISRTFKSFQVSTWWYDEHSHELCQTVLNFRPYYRGHWYLGTRKTKIQKKAAIFDQRASPITGHLIFTCQLAQTKKRILGTPWCHMWLENKKWRIQARSPPNILAALSQTSCF